MEFHISVVEILNYENFEFSNLVGSGSKVTFYEQGGIIIIFLSIFWIIVFYEMIFPWIERIIQFAWAMKIIFPWPPVRFKNLLETKLGT